MRLGMTALLALAVAGAGRAEFDAAKLEYFEKKVRPVLVGHCFACHSAETKPAGGLRVDDREGLLAGGNTGPALVPGKPDESPLVRRTLATARRRMPAEGEHLTDEQTAVLSKWIADGAAWPAAKLPSTVGGPNAEYDRLKRDHWAFRPVATPAVPTPKQADWARSDVDRFLLKALESKNLSPVGDADRVTLVRRLSFDLTGLPPTPEDADAFVKDTRPDAYERLVDRLLASPAFAERWGRHWLDVARYGESTGPSRNIPYPHAWKYRDYVIDAVGRDVPFDRFLTEQVAGDRLPAASDAERDRLLTATGFLALGVKDVNQRFKVRFVMDNVDEQIDAVTRGILGLTVSCARCHDHKFDPVPTADYYALAGIFTSTDNCAGVRNKMGGGGLDYYDPAMLVKLSGEGPPVDPKRVEELKAKVAVAQKEWDAIRGTPEGLSRGPNGQPKQRPFRLKLERLQGELLGLTDPAARGHAVHGARDAKAVADTAIRVRGEAEKLGPVVPRGFLTAFPVPGAPAVDPKSSGRLELAAWLTSPSNPLTPRVAVNRVWAHLFGAGLVSTVDNFGVTGDVPSHPELLDHLAGGFVRDGWSVKRLVRKLVLTRAYRLDSAATPANRDADPANRLLWRHAPRRLSAEEVRDGVLLAAGVLDAKRPEASPSKKLPMIEMRDNGPEARTIGSAADGSRSRSVYLPLLRGVVPAALEPFDPVEQTLVTGTRDATTVPAQALFVLNSTFVRKNAVALAERVLADPIASDPQRVAHAYRLTLGRGPTDAEAARAVSFVGEYEQLSREVPSEPEPAAPVAVAAVEKPARPAAPVVDPDQVDQSAARLVEERVRAKDTRTAAWAALAQALYGSAEFRYVR